MNPKPRAIILDVYRTILHVGVPPEDQETPWDALTREIFGEPCPRRLTAASFMDHCRKVIDREQAEARQAGIAYPEIFWPEVILEVLPELREVPGFVRDTFMHRQISLLRPVQLMPGAADFLTRLAHEPLLVGLASNAQPYTLRELAELLESAGLQFDMFRQDLTFWSWEYGFSKPDPHVFRLLTTRLRTFGIRASEILMVGDRLDNDIEPARAQGWQTWLFTEQSDSRQPSTGDWAALARHLGWP